MIKLNKSLNPPATLQSNQVQQEQQRISNLVASGLLPTYKDFKSDLYGAADVKAQLLSDQYDKCIFCTTIALLELNRKDLLELRKRKYNKFITEMERQHLSFDDKLQQDINDEISEGRSEENIEFLGMFKNQKYKF